MLIESGLIVRRREQRALPRRGKRNLGWLGVLTAAVLVPAGVAHGDPASRSDNPVFTIPKPGAPPSVVGSSTLVRTPNGVSVTLETSSLESGHVVTLWWIVANSPDECDFGIPGLSQCGPADHEAGLGDMSVLNAAGRIVGEDGGGDYGAHLRVGDISRALFEGEPGLVNPRGAEVILVLKSHGPKIPRLTSEMLSTFAAGCADQTTPPSLDTREGMVGTADENDCGEIQISVHSPT